MEYFSSATNVESIQISAALQEHARKAPRTENVSAKLPCLPKLGLPDILKWKPVAKGTAKHEGKALILSAEQGLKTIQSMEDLERHTEQLKILDSCILIKCHLFKDFLLWRKMACCHIIKDCIIMYKVQWVKQGH